MVLSGPRTEPDARAVAMARALPNAFAAWRPAIESALFEHHGAGAEPLTEGELQLAAGAVPNIGTASQVWQHASLVFVAVTPLDGVLTTEIGYTTDWDEEHTLGARLRDGKLLELCGSVLRP
ncbi:hypothetical protein QTI66_13015 [Variovorax sp. J22R133]|uniref:DUF6985 domain-containing protein n=1 Tax=Variovorax brevis TaxID=3053503 RepID=UPI002576500F|nr:hypothetical protein [Variovorax sp. J22R133]MDM0113072.1 hypothetical protein [Variovorax sp. J22R133]